MFAFINIFAELVVVVRSSPVSVVLGGCGGGVGLIIDTTVGVTVAVGMGSLRIWIDTGVAEMGGDSLEGILRLVRTAGPKHDASSLKSSKEQFRNMGHGRLLPAVSVASHADLTNTHRLLHVFTLVAIVVDGSIKHSGK